MNTRIERLRVLLLNPKLTKYKEKESDTVIQQYGILKFEITDKNEIGENIFSFKNIDDFESLITEFDRGLNIENVLEILINKLSHNNIDQEGEFNLRIITS